jgi:histidinol-phosphate/aromatic aminotransferase/cobyric acid decarboxylase-like protein/choline kinase
MKAIILTAGYGNRMKPMTNNNHKTLLKIGNETIIQRIINGLIINDVRDIVIVTGYLGDKLSGYLLNAFPDIQFTYVHNPRYLETNNIYSLALAFNNIEINDDILLIESDLIYEEQVIKRVISSPYPNVALVDKFRSGMDGTVVTVENNIVTNIIPPHLQGHNFIFSDKYKTLNIYKFSQEFVKTSFKNLLNFYTQSIGDTCYYEFILGILIYIRQDVIYAEIIQNEKWTEVDDPNDLRVAEFMFNKPAQQKILEDTFGGYWNYDIIDFCFIRNMYFPNNSILSELKNNFENLIHNYGSKQVILNQKLAYFLLCREECVNLLNGASQIYPIVGNIFKDSKVLIPSPSFGEYSRIFSNSLTYSDSIGFNISEINEKVNHADLIVFVNPNNPTGSCLSTRYIYDLAMLHPGKTFIVDESFIDFSNDVSIVSLLEKGPLENVIVIKSLSKALGVPGMRLGYVYTANAQVNNLIKKQIPIWNSNSIAEFFLEIILKHRNSLQDSFNKTIKDRNGFSDALSGLSFIAKVYPSSGNYLLVEFKDSLKSDQLAEYLLTKHSIYIKNISGKFNSGKYLSRFAVRLPEENQKLVNALVQFFE